MNPASGQVTLTWSLVARVNDGHAVFDLVYDREGGVLSKGDLASLLDQAKQIVLGAPGT